MTSSKKPTHHILDEIKHNNEIKSRIPDEYDDDMKNKIEKMGDKAGEGKGKKAHNMMRGLGFGNL